MFVTRIETEDPGEVHGWFQDGAIDLFVWFDTSGLSQAQVTAGSDAAEWKPPARLHTGHVRETPAEKSRRGAESGNPDACNTFGSDEL